MEVRAGALLKDLIDHEHGKEQNAGLGWLKEKSHLLLHGPADHDKNR
jgi:hypothetical protein